MSGEQQNGEWDWADNPRLNGWLAAQQAAFPAWCRQTGQEWDFTPESLDRLEDLIRRQFSTWEQVEAAGEDPIVAVPTWYLGEVQNRHFGTVWRCRPGPPPSPARGNAPFVILPEKPSGEDQEYDADESEPYDDNPIGCDPAGEIRALFLRGPENRLRDVLTRYTRWLPRS